MKWRRVAGIVFVVAAFAFLGSKIYPNISQLRAQEWEVRPFLMLASLLLNIAGLFWGIAAWRVLLRVMGQAVPFRDLARIGFVSGLGRYIPGKVWQFVGAAHIARTSGITAGTIVTGLAAHTIFFLIGAAFVSVYFVPEVLGVSPQGIRVLRWLTPLLFLLVHPTVIRNGLHLVRRITRKELVEWTGGWGIGVGLVALSVIGWTISGSAFFLFILSFTPIPVSVLPTVIGINAASFIWGTLFFPAPAGLGAKEVALTTMLTGYVVAPVAAVIAIAARLWTVAAEVIPALILLASAPRDSIDEGRPGSARISPRATDA